MRTVLGFFVNTFIIILFVTFAIYIFPVSEASSYCTPGFIDFYENLFGNLNIIPTMCMLFGDPIMLLVLLAVIVIILYVVKVFIRSSYDNTKRYI